MDGGADIGDVNSPSGGPGPNARGGGGEVYYASEQTMQGAVTESDPTSIDAPAAPASAITLYYVTDHLGTVRAVVNDQGTLVERHDYTPFGVEIPPSTNVAENTHQYTGQERDETTGMDFMHYRYYGSNLGRFMKPDNVVGSALNPQDWNLYGYVHGNPVNFNDPTGHLYMPPNRNGLKLMSVGGFGGFEEAENDALLFGMEVAEWGNSLPGPITAYDMYTQASNGDWKMIGTVTAPSSGGHASSRHWKLAPFDADIAAYLQKLVVENKGEVAACVFKVSDRLTAFWYDVDPPSSRVINRGSSDLMHRALVAGGKYGGKYSKAKWSWTNVLHVHPPPLVRSHAPFAYWDDNVGMRRFATSWRTADGAGPGDTPAYEIYSQQLGGQTPSMGLIDAQGDYYQYTP